ncbi:alpha/beta hydrolase family protein [Maribacter sp. 2210JD10-5]|uniref:alpha/beta hydrolase family protein n=1 Tax=Maribacter sp. 2210JD10-5 TaxID=3386272 RepID=UPI0039BC23F8
MYRVLVLLFFSLLVFHGEAQLEKQLLDFEFEGVNLNGVLNTPKNRVPKGIILIVHGSGQTNAIAQEWWYDVRQAVINAGYATYMWDKMGCGKSEGTFNYNQTVQNSALEAIAAISMLKEKHVGGSEKIGLWGISRAGWINPIVIDRYKDIDLWISVSGVDDDETFKYLLEQNLRINGHTIDEVDQIVGEWHNGVLLSRNGKSYEEYLAATPTLQKNEFWLRFNNGGIKEKGYYEYQKVLKEAKLDKESKLPLYVEDFEKMLSKVDIPVLAIFGEKDMHVDWKQTKKLYERTLASNKQLTIKTFPKGNHNLHQCKTGGFYEFEDDKLPYARCDGFLDAITSWLEERE